VAVLIKVLGLASVALVLRAQVPAQETAAAHARAAQEAERQNDFATAVRQWRYVAKLFPSSAEVQSNLGVALYFDHQWPEALNAFAKAMASRPDLLAPHLFSGLAWYRVSNPDATVPELSKAVTLNPADTLAHTWLGYAYVAQSKYDLAVHQFYAARQLDPDNIDIWYALGQTYLQVSKDATTRLLMAAADGARIWQLAGEQAELQNDRRRALADYQGALQLRPDLEEVSKAVIRLGGDTPHPSHQSATAHNVHEDELYQQAHQAEEQARLAFEHVMRQAPDSYRAHQILADSLTLQQRPEEANAEYQKVLADKPDLPGIHQAMGLNLLRAGKTLEVLAQFNAEIAVEPRSAPAHTRTGQVLLLLGRDEEARKMFARAQEMDRPPADLYRLLGKLDLRRQDYRAAVTALTHYVSQTARDASAYYLLSKAYAGLGDRERMRQALSYFEKASRDIKARNQAQTELANFERPQEPDQRIESADGTLR
jgi:tetratricopeptide (TPR) repeat protein